MISVHYVMFITLCLDFQDKGKEEESLTIAGVKFPDKTLRQ